MQKLPKVLLVDDDSTAIFLNSLLLNNLGVAEQLLIARNGVEALQTLDRTCCESIASADPLLVLLDINMPVMSGADFLEVYHQHPLAQKCRLVVVVLTSSEHCRDLDRIKALPVSADILTKPLTREKVALILEQHFQRQLLA